jgi:hypothetical protein
MNRVLGYLLAVVILGVLAAGWIGSLRPQGQEVRLTGPGTIVIARSDIFGALKRPPVPFEHGKHVKALKKEGCTACHEDHGGKLQFDFVGTDASAQHPMAAYHDRCIGCHKKRAAAGASAGPQACGDCHVPGAAWLNSRRPAGLDLLLHERHVDAFGGDKSCDTCHRVKDPTASRLIYEMSADLKGLPLEQAAHIACVGCHYERTVRHEKAGPLACAECHEKHALPERLDLPENLPAGYRLLRGQKDIEVIDVGEGLARMPGVTFDHKLHEGVVSSCRACHHDSLQTCDTCHTVSGHAQGGGVKLATAYHEPFSLESCVGCHRGRMELAPCAGCHGSDIVKPISNKTSCPVCHHRGERSLVHPDISGYPSGVITIENKYTGVLADHYGPASLDHGKHITRLRELMRENGGDLLADQFHGDRQFVCMSCHHHSPPIQEGTKPPRCISCHAQQPDPEEPESPASPAAYHERCEGCHQRLNVKKDGHALGCKDCHLRSKGEI